MDRVRIAWVEDRLYGVQRARPDVPEDNTESTERESPRAVVSRLTLTVFAFQPTKPWRTTLTDPAEPGVLAGPAVKLG